MSDFRRWFLPGATYFITVVSYDRRPILTSDPARKILREAIARTRKTYPFHVFATVLLPDHWHLVLQMPSGQTDYSVRVKSIENRFTRTWLANELGEAKVTGSQAANHERGIWQPRFWEHSVRDELDLERCVDYVHWNPRKHGLVERVRDWPWSSFHRFVTEGQYDACWGGTMPTSIKAKSSWGEP